MKRIAEAFGRIKTIQHIKAYGIIVVAVMLILPLGMIAAKQTPAIEVLVDGRVMGYTRSTVEARKALNTAKHQMNGQDGELTLVDTEIEFRTTDEKYKKSNTEAELVEQMALVLEEKNSKTKQLAYTVKIGDYLVTLDSRDAVEEVLDQAQAKYNKTGDFAVALVADPSKETGSMTTSIIKAAKIEKQQNRAMSASDSDEAVELAQTNANVSGTAKTSDTADVKENDTKESNAKEESNAVKASSAEKTTTKDKAVLKDKEDAEDKTTSKAKGKQTSKAKTSSKKTAESKAKSTSKETTESKAKTVPKKKSAAKEKASSAAKTASKKSSSAKKADEVVRIDFAEEIQIQETYVEQEEVSSVEEAVSDITKDKTANETYTVKSGDTISTIANGHDLTVKEFLKLNKGLKEKDAIYPDDEVIITVPKPELTVLVQQEEHSTEKYSAAVKYIENDDLYEGETKVKKKGKQGVREITALVNYSNGEEDSREIVSEEIVKKAVAKVVERGTKVRPTFIKPLSGGTFTSGFKFRWGREHKGLDWATPVGTSVFASSSGTVSYAGWMNGYGNCITINHGDGRQTRYAHLSEVQVSVGQSVTQGDKIALSGNTGRSTGPHVHFEILINGTQVDPFDYL